MTAEIAVGLMSTHNIAQNVNARTEAEQQQTQELQMMVVTICLISRTAGMVRHLSFLGGTVHFHDWIGFVDLSLQVTAMLILYGLEMVIVMMIITILDAAMIVETAVG